MILQVHIPPYPLNDFIESFVYFKESDPIQRIERFLPDSNIELVIDLTDKPKLIYDNITLNGIQQCTNSWFSGMRTKPISIPGGDNSEMFIVYFKKGMAYQFAKVPMYEITDTVTDTELLFGKDILDLRYQLKTTLSIQGKFQLAEQYFMKHYTPGRIINPVVQFAINNIITQPDSLTIDKIQQNIGYSHKHFIKLFRYYTGVTPKVFQRITRFQKVIKDIQASKDIHWTQLAASCGYFDQSHFIADFKHFSGFTPKEYLDLKGDDLNYVPVG